jgi:hypothetical protein
MADKCLPEYYLLLGVMHDGDITLHSYVILPSISIAFRREIASISM